MTLPYISEWESIIFIAISVRVLTQGHWGGSWGRDAVSGLPGKHGFLIVVHCCHQVSYLKKLILGQLSYVCSWYEHQPFWWCVPDWCVWMCVCVQKECMCKRVSVCVRVCLCVCKKCGSECVAWVLCVSVRRQSAHPLMQARICVDTYICQILLCLSSLIYIHLCFNVTNFQGKVLTMISWSLQRFTWTGEVMRYQGCKINVCMIVENVHEFTFCAQHAFIGCFICDVMFPTLWRHYVTLLMAWAAMQNTFFSLVHFSPQISLLNKTSFHFPLLFQYIFLSLKIHRKIPCRIDEFSASFLSSCFSFSIFWFYLCVILYIFPFLHVSLPQISLLESWVSFWECKCWLWLLFTSCVRSHRTGTVHTCKERFHRANACAWKKWKLGRGDLSHFWKIWKENNKTSSINKTIIYFGFLRTS